MNLKQSDIQKCCGCGKGVLHDRAITFYVVTITRCVADMGAINRQHGFEQMMHPMPQLAAVMGPNEDMATPLGELLTVWVCDQCAMDRPLMMLHEAALSRAETAEMPVASE